MINVTLRAAHTVWLVTDETGKLLAKVNNVSHLPQLAMYKRWNVLNKSCLNDKLANQLPRYEL